MIRALTAALLALASGAHAGCAVWDTHDPGATGPGSQRVMIRTDLEDLGPLLAQAAGAAARRAEARDLVFVDVFLTRAQDMVTAEDHGEQSALVWLRYNPGGTGRIRGTVEVRAIADPKDLTYSHGMLLRGDDYALKADIPEGRVDTAAATHPDAYTTPCTGE
ncbi:hypothetical protein [Sagittula sp.]|uniref:hypothetical protein n=1 Tax=Sagittula sp. TaxID=2038081 RepID=UPI0035149FBE